MTLCGGAGAQEMLLPEMPLHDPFILAYAPTKTYYLYTSNVPSLTQVKRVGTMVYASKDLKHWAAPKVVFTVPEGFWAEVAGGLRRYMNGAGSSICLLRCITRKRSWFSRVRWDMQRICAGR